MTYESIDRLKKYMQKKIDVIVTGEKVTFNINAHQLLDEINEMECKAQAYDLLKEDLLINEKVFRKQAENDEVSDIIHGHYVALLEQSKLERADNEE